MPIYEYKCEECGIFEQFQPITAESLKICPKCSSSIQRLISKNVQVMYKTGGFYTTDNRPSNYECTESKCKKICDSKVS